MAIRLGIPNHMIIMASDINVSSELTVTDKENTMEEKDKKHGKLTSEKDVNTDSEPVEWEEDGAEEDEARTELGLVIRICTNRHVNQNAFTTTMKNIWQAKHDMDIKNIGKNLYVVQFYHWRDKHRVMEGQPWHFDKHVILMSDIKGNCKPSDIQLWEFPIWARVYDLPFKGRLNINNVKAIGNKIGSFITMDKSGAMGIDKSIRIRVMHDVRKPLTSSIKVRMKSGEEDIFTVKYERPPLFCFYCGKVGHGTKDCEEDDAEDEGVVKYGGWIKASPWKVADAGEKGGGRANESSCARTLFITKPKKTVGEEEKESMSAVVEKFTNCVLQEKAIEQGVDTEYISNDRMMPSGVNMIMEDAVANCGEEVIKQNESNKSKEGMSSACVAQSRSKAGKEVKKWKKVARQRDKVDNGVPNIVGVKRNERDGGCVGLDNVEIEELRYLKRVGLSVQDDVSLTTISTENEVASPTIWALGDK